MEKLNFFGVGPKIGLIGLPCLILTIVISVFYKVPFRYVMKNSKPLIIAGIFLLVAGLVFYMATGKLLMKGLKQTRLITSGTYFCCRNPLYAAFILMIIPGLSLLLNSWLILAPGLIMYLVFKILIKKEYTELELFFGEQYRSYKSETPELLPIPAKKILRNRRK